MCPNATGKFIDLLLISLKSNFTQVQEVLGFLEMSMRLSTDDIRKVAANMIVNNACSESLQDDVTWNPC